MSGLKKGARPKTSTQRSDFAYGAQIPQMITDATKAQRDEEFRIYLGQIRMEKDDFLENLRKHRCKLEDFYTYLDALTLADEDTGESLDDLIGQLSPMKIGGGGMRQVGGSLGALLALHIKIFNRPVEVAVLTVGASLLLLQNTIELLNSLDKCFVYYGRALLTKILDWMITVCKFLYDNREGIKDGAKTAASAVGPAMRKGATVGADVLVATPGAILDILIGVDALGMQFATWYNPPDNGFREIMEKVKRDNEAYHGREAVRRGKEAVAVKKATDKTMMLQEKDREVLLNLKSEQAIKAANDAASILHGELGTSILTNSISGVITELGNRGKRGGPSAGARPMELDLGGGGKRATRKRGKRSSKRAPRKTKTTRKKRRGKK